METNAFNYTPYRYRTKGYVLFDKHIIEFEEIELISVLGSEGEKLKDICSFLNGAYRLGYMQAEKDIARRN
jgi:hypothetical protein